MNYILLFFCAFPFCLSAAVSVPIQVVGQAQAFEVHANGALFNKKKVLLSKRVTIPMSSYVPRYDYFQRVQTEQEFPVHYVVNETDDQLTVLLEGSEQCEGLKGAVNANTVVQIDPQVLQLPKGKKIRSPQNRNKIVVEYEDRKICPLQQVSVYDQKGQQVGTASFKASPLSLTFIIRKKASLIPNETSNNYTITVYHTADMAQALT